jgi:hypothetical protein
MAHLSPFVRFESKSLPLMILKSPARVGVITISLPDFSL